MDVYLVRHGRARAVAEDPARALTPSGIRDAEAAARWAGETGVRVSQILHSGKKRAEQTAEIFARELRPSHGVVPARGLSPNDDVAPTADLIQAGTESLMIVGHLPFLSRLASLLIAGDPERVGFVFVEASVLCLHRHDGRWFLWWMVTPEQVATSG